MRIYFSMATSLSNSSWFYSSILDGLVWFNDLNILEAASFSIGTPAPNSCLGWRRLMAAHPLDPPASTLLSFSFFFLSGLAQRQKKDTKIKARTKKQRQQKHFICLFLFHLNSAPVLLRVAHKLWILVFLSCTYWSLVGVSCFMILCSKAMASP